MNEVSVGMTSMFRDPILWNNLRILLSKKYSQRDSISIWHAGCSTGEEVYSLGILLEETELKNKAKALATDFNRNAIQEAEQGVYHKIKMLENESNYREFNAQCDFTKYYSTDGKSAKMNPQLIEHVTFEYQNLITDPFPSGFDIIFCRNVMIYFDSIAKKKILAKFYESLNPGGYFIIGFFDTMGYLMDNDKFKLVDEEAKIFQRI
jgi:chemotaxis protein methyltransferase CheR